VVTGFGDGGGAERPQPMSQKSPQAETKTAARRTRIGRQAEFIARTL
jgi:hypothetical protein